MLNTKSSLIKKFLIIPPIIVGIAVFMYFSQNKQAPKKRDKLNTARIVKVMKAEKVNIAPRYNGFGEIAPAKTWKAVSRVSGDITYIHPDLKKGEIIKADTVLIKINPAEYKLAVAQAEANLSSAKTELEQLAVSEENSGLLLKLEKKRLRLSQRDLQRQKSLLKKKVISNSVYEDSEKGTITQESAVKTLENSLKLIPTNRKLLLAKIKQMEAALENKKLQLSYTEVKMPFEGRISAVNVEKSEYIQTGKTLIETSGTDIVEIEANFSREVSRLLFSGLVSKSVSKIKAIVRPAGADSETFWKAEFKRISGEIDPETRTIEVTVQIKFQDNGIKSSKNLLIPGTYCEVILQGNADPNRIVIPRSALHENNSVYILDEKQKLKKTQVKIDYKIGNLYVIESGIVPEETVILTDVVPAINGMKLTPKLDTDRVARLKKEARGNLL